MTIEGFAPVAVDLDCDAGAHRITWRDGELTLENHDVEAERAMVALGGEPPLCLDVLDAWTAAVANPHGWVSLAIAPQGGKRPSLIALRAQVMTVTRAPVSGPQWTNPPPQLPPHVLARLRAQTQSRAYWRSQLIANLPDELKPVLVATCVYEIDRRWHRDTFETSRAVEFGFDDILEAKAGWALRESLASWAPPGGLVRIPIHMQFNFLVPDERPSIVVELMGSTALVDVGLPLRWLADVWARGCMLVDGCFVLDVTDARNEGTTLRARAVRWERSRNAFVPVVAHALLARVDDEWTLAWTGEPPEST